MVDGFEPELLNRWFPVLRAPEAVPRHVARVQLLGEEIALWRDDAGLVNAWANQCPHRGVRLSIGGNFGDRLKCRYHGWEFASGTAQCVAIPAHPDLVPSKSQRVRAYAAAEKYGYVWVAIGGAATPPAVAPLDGTDFVTLRSIAIHAAAADIAAHLAASDAFAGMRALDPFIIEGRIREANAGAVMLMQPVDGDSTVLHALAAEGAGDAMALRRLCNHILLEARATLEARR